MQIEFADLLSRLHDLNGTTVQVHGRVIVDGAQRCWLSETYDEYLAGRRLVVDDDRQIVRQLLAVFPASGGGREIYDEEGWLVGRVEGTTLCPVTSWRLRSDDDQFEIRFQQSV